MQFSKVLSVGLIVAALSSCNNHADQSTTAASKSSTSAGGGISVEASSTAIGIQVTCKGRGTTYAYGDAKMSGRLLYTSTFDENFERKIQGKLEIDAYNNSTREYLDTVEFAGIAKFYGLDSDHKTVGVVELYPVTDNWKSQISVVGLFGQGETRNVSYIKNTNGYVMLSSCVLSPVN